MRIWPFAVASGPRRAVTPSGSFSWAIPIRSSTRPRAHDRSTSSRNTKNTIEKPKPDIERITFTPGVPVRPTESG